MGDQNRKDPGFSRRALTYLSSLLQRPGEGEAAEGNEGNEVKKRTPIHNWFAAIGSLALAFIIWLFVMGSENPGAMGEFNDVPIRIENESGLAILSGEDLAVDLRVEGKGSVIRATDISDIDVSIHIEEGTKPGRYTYDIAIQLPGGLRLIESSMTKAMIYLDNTTSAIVPVRVNLSDYILQDSYEIDLSAITTSLTTVKVTGPQALLETIECARVSLSLGFVSRSVTCKGALRLVDNEGNVITSSYVKLAESVVDVTIPIYKYRTITPTVTFMHGLFHEGNVSVSISPATVTVKGEVDAVDALTFDTLINEKELADNATFTVPLTADKGIEIVDDVSELTVTIMHHSATTKKVVIRDFTVANAGENLLCEVLTPSLTVDFRVNGELMDDFGAQAVLAFVDLSSYVLTPGTITVPVTFYFQGAYEGKAWEIGSYSVSVRITNAPAEADPADPGETSR